MLALNTKGFPSAAASKEAYLNAIEKMGFSAAHVALLEEAKEWLSDHGHSIESMAGEGKLIHHSATYHAREAGVPVPDRGALCILLTSVFETQGIPIVSEERTQAVDVLRKFMHEAGISDENEARRRYVEASVEAALANAREREALEAAEDDDDDDDDEDDDDAEEVDEKPRRK